MGQRVRRSHRGQGPSSARQLPILAALHARSPTLFEDILHEIVQKVNPQFPDFVKNPSFSAAHILFCGL